MVFEKIQQKCSEKGVSIYRLEKDLGFSPSCVKKWKNSIPTADKLLKVAKYFDVPIEYFLQE